jgi:dolichol-phosphate mannosyltransferase
MNLFPVFAIFGYVLSRMHVGQTKLILFVRRFYYLCKIVKFRPEMRKIVIIPTYNEQENIALIIDRVISLHEQFDILVVDDGSPDDTAGIVKLLQKSHQGRLHLLERSGKFGLGSAYIAGFRWALEHSYDWIFEMDADFSHNPDDLEKLYGKATGAEGETGADVVVGSRYVTGVNVINWPMSRLLISWFASRYVRFVTRMPVCDATAGFVCYSRKVLERIDLDAIKMKGYGFQIEMKYTAWKLGFRIREVSIIFIDRTLGTSKMSSGIFGEALWGVLALRFRKIRGK